MRYIIALALAIACMYVGATLAHAHATPMPAGMRAYVTCTRGSEDSYAHVRMVTYVPHAYVVYVCEHHGY
jgi:hypothetical protein